MLKWLIVGGGLHGAYLSNVLTGAHGINSKHVRILDPEPELLAAWFRKTQNTGMTHLRSPIVHHLGLDPADLRKYSRAWSERSCCISPYDRPGLAMFNDHCREVIKRNSLGKMHIRGRALRFDPTRDHVCVETDSGMLRAKRVIMALGSPPPRIPDWARGLAQDGAPVHHLFGNGFSSETLDTTGLTLVVGGGISAAQFATQMADRGAEDVVVLARNQPRVHEFDADSSWLGPKYMSRFKREEPRGRRRLITGARHVGSMPGDVFRRLKKHQARDHVSWIQGEVTGCKYEDGLILVKTADQLLIADRLILATGHHPEPAGKAMLANLNQEHQLPLAPCGYPVLDRFLRWHSRLFLTGGLGELTLGPMAGNIAGARRAGNLISSLVRAF